MLGTLLESKAKKERSQAGVALSVGAHSVLIGAALYATAQARPELSKPTEMVRPLYFPPPVHAARSQALATTSARVRVSQLRFVPPSIDITVPVVEIPTTFSRPSDFNSGAVFGATVDGPVRGNSEGGHNAPFLTDQVEKQVSLEAGAKPPRYPETLRAAGVEGRVVALFVVSERGVVEEGSIRILRSDNPLFDEAVRSALGRMRFVPAEIGGKKVRQLVQMPFLFTLSR
jgi:protein TonB